MSFGIHWQKLTKSLLPIVVAFGYHSNEARFDTGKDNILPLNKPKNTANVNISDARSCIPVV